MSSGFHGAEALTAFQTLVAQGVPHGLVFIEIFNGISMFFPKASPMLGFSFSCLTAWGSDLGCADGCGRQMGAEIAWTAADGVGATEWLEMGGEKKPLVMSDLGCADGCGRRGCN